MAYEKRSQQPAIMKRCGKTEKAMSEHVEPMDQCEDGSQTSWTAPTRRPGLAAATQNLRRPTPSDHRANHRTAGVLKTLAHDQAYS
jgi:hypothetical protein